MTTQNRTSTLVTESRCPDGGSNNIVVIGGGAGGSFTALELARSGYTVDLIDKNQELMRGSCDITPGRMGLGFHYADAPTAIRYLRSTIRFCKEYGQFREQGHLPQDHQLRRGRYFIMRDSTKPPEQVLSIYQQLQAEYRRLVHDDPSSQLFGPPEQFLRILEPHEYDEDVVAENIAYGLETAEELINWSVLREYMLNNIDYFENSPGKICGQSNPHKIGRIRVHLNTEVIGIDRKGPLNHYNIRVVSQEDEVGHICRIITGSMVVNAAWENIEAINAMIGLAGRKRMNRIKAIATIRLPDSMVSKPSMFFCAGPHCMLSNKGGGIGMITYAPVTNIAISTARVMEPEFARILYSLSPKEIKDYGERILAGASMYIPGLSEAKVLHVGTGVVQTYQENTEVSEGSPDITRLDQRQSIQVGNLNHLHRARGGINTRDYDGVEILEPGFIVNACMKLLYCKDNGVKVTEIIQKWNANNQDSVTQVVSSLRLSSQL